MNVGPLTNHVNIDSAIFGSLWCDRRTFVRIAHAEAPMAEVVDLADGIAELVHDGDTVALEGFTHLIPMRAGHEIIRQGRRDLTLVRMTPDLVYDQLIGAGCASRLVFSWGGNPG